MIPYFSYEQFSVGFITIHIWGLLVGLGFAIGAWYTLKQARQSSFNENKILNLILVIFIFSFIGARLLYTFQFGLNYFKQGEIFRVWDGGLMMYGGVLGAIIGSLIYIYFSYPLMLDTDGSITRKQEIFKIADLFAPGIALGLIIGRIGCFLVNDHAGAITKAPWAIKFPDGSLRHPVILYLIISNIVLFGLLLILKNRLRHTGALFLLFILWYSMGRLVLDFFRANDAAGLTDPRMFNLTVSQFISMAILLAAAIVILFLPKFIVDPPWAENNN